MLPFPFNPPPSSGRRPYFKSDGGGHADRSDPDTLLLAFAVTLAGVVGFLGLLVAGSLLPSYATPLRALALVWFAVFGVWHVKVSMRIR
jgi:hypothetical protein